MQKKQLIKFRCPKCDQLLRTDDELSGTETKCPSCSTMLIVPDATADTSFSYNYKNLSDARLEKLLANESDLGKRDIIFEELTKRFTNYYIHLLENESGAKKRRGIATELKTRLVSYFLLLRTFSRKLISYLSREL